MKISLMNNRTISWITPSYFLDVDLPIVNELCKQYTIYWIVLLGNNGNSDDEAFINAKINKCDKLCVTYYHYKTRWYTLGRISEINKVIDLAKSVSPDLYYLSESFLPYGTILYRRKLPIDKCVVACHNVTTPKGARHEMLARWYTNRWLNTFTNIQTFSECQRKVLLSKYRNKNVLTAHLAIKDYGEPTKLVDKTELPYIRFLVFGNIVHYKRIDLLLNAVNILYDRGIKNFRVRIAGYCRQWNDEYAGLVKHPELFELMIKRIPNEDVANLFVDSHYFVMPYQDIAQSGAMIVAFRYNLPLILSDIPQFKEFVDDGVNGFTFHTKNVTSLADKMEWIINSHQLMYDKVCANQRKFVDENFSLRAITKLYREYFDKL